MELKVWVEGIKRVVCGVTDSTSCQDIVIALAHAMGRTGRFTLIEKWRDNERPLSPSECPLLVLQKWGEFANEVQLCLFESGSKQIKSQQEKESERTKDRFTHNFTPPPKPPEQLVKRSLTFSGARNSVNSRNHHKNYMQGPPNHVIPQKLNGPERVMSDGNSWSSSSSLSSQNSAVYPSQLKVSPTAQGSSHERSRQSPSVQLHPHHHQNMPQRHNLHPANQHSTNNSSQNQPASHLWQAKQQNSDISILNVIQNRTSAFQPVRPRHNSVENEIPNTRLPEMDIPVYSADIRAKSSHKPDVEEYDLDSNFPDVVKETGREYLIEEYHVPGKQGHRHGSEGQNSKEEKEKMKLLRLVSVQLDRIKMQDTQLSLVDTEIISREESQRELEQKLQNVTDDIIHLGGLHDELNRELLDLDGGRLIEDIEKEKQMEKKIKSDITSLQSRLEQCEANLRQFQAKVKMCSEELDKEKVVVESDEKRRREEEMKMKEEISQIQKDLSERLKGEENFTKSEKDLEEKLKDIEKCLQEKTTEYSLLEKSLKDENLKSFKEPSAEASKQQELSGEAVLKVLEGGLKSSDAGFRSRSKILASPLTIIISSKNPNGVWV